MASLYTYIIYVARSSKSDIIYCSTAVCVYIIIKSSFAPSSFNMWLRTSNKKNNSRCNLAFKRTQLMSIFSEQASSVLFFSFLTCLQKRQEIIFMEKVDKRFNVL